MAEPASCAHSIHQTFFTEKAAHVVGDAIVELDLLFQDRCHVPVQILASLDQCADFVSQRTNVFNLMIEYFNRSVRAPDKQSSRARTDSSV